MFDYEKRQYQLDSAMQDARNDFINKLSIAVHPKYVESFSKLLEYALFENFEEAENLAGELNISRTELLAYSGEADLFEEEYIKDMEMLYYA